MIKTYKFNGIAPVPAEIIAKCLAEIEEKYGDNDPKHIIAEAKNKKHPLHGCFTWNKTLAAEKQWMREAKYLIVNLLIYTPETNEYNRAFVSITRDEDEKLTTNPFSKGERVFVNLETALDDVELRQHLFNRALKELTNFKNKYKRLNRLNKVLEAIDELQLELA